MSTEQPQNYTQNDYELVKNHIQTIKNSAILLGRSEVVNASVGSMLEETHDRYESSKDTIFQWASDDTIQLHEAIKLQYQAFKNNSISFYDKTLAVTRDYGLGNVQGVKAIDLLNAYNQYYGNSDPLGIKKYNNDYKALINDLSTFTKDTNAKFVVLATIDAQDWAKKYVSNWGVMSQDEKDAFSVYVYNIGTEKATQKYEEKIKTLGKYEVNIDLPGTADDTLISMEYLLNKDKIKALANNTQYGLYSDINFSDGGFVRFNNSYDVTVTTFDFSNATQGEYVFSPTI